MTARVTVNAFQRRVGIDVEHLVLQPSKRKRGVVIPLSSAVVGSFSLFRSQIICTFVNMSLKPRGLIGD